MSKITEYFKDTRSELKHVVWPSRLQTIMYTVAVVLLSLFVAYLLGIFDFLFSRGLEKLLSL